MAYEIDLSGRVAFVTGATGGLGAQFAKTLAAAGAGVVLASDLSHFIHGSVISADDGCAV